MPPVEQFGPAMARFVLGAIRHARAPSAGTPRFLIYVAPWYRQAAGWFSIALGVALAMRVGAPVSFLIDDMPYPAIHPDELNEIAAFDAFCREFEALFPFRRLGAFAGAPEPARRSPLETVVEEALAHDLRHRTGIGTLARAHAASFARTAHTPLFHLATALDNALRAEPCDVLFCPGGVANGSYVPKRLAEMHGLRFASADSAFGALLVAAHGIAAHAEENAETHAWLKTAPTRDLAIARGHALLAAKVAAAKNAPAESFDLVLPLGYDYDTAALGIGSLYATQDEWLHDTIQFVRRECPDARMVVRQHPHEAKFPCAENTALVAQLAAANIPNLRIMRVAEDIPVYPLLLSAKACVACQSTVVLEAQMLGLPSVSARDKYFVHAGVIARPPDRARYYDWLRAYLKGQRTEVAKDARDSAALMYFVLEECMTARTQFTPHASDLWSWLNGDPQAAMKEHDFSDLLRCFAANVPLTTIAARRILGLAPLPEGVADPLDEG